MAKVDYIKIKFDKTSPVYAPGEKVSGKLNIKLKETLKCRSIDLDFIGDCYCQWSELVIKKAARGKPIKQTRELKSNEIYLNRKVVLMSKKDGSEFSLGTGEKSFPFEIELPDKLATSFEHNFGRIRYSVNGSLITSNGIVKVATRFFTVINPCDLNQYPVLQESYGTSATKVICCSLCARTPIECKFSVKKRGYVPGEKILFEFVIDNRSSKNITEIQVNLLQKARFHAEGKIKSSLRLVSTVQYSKKVSPNNKETWEGSLTIPPVCSSLIGECKIINVSYILLCNFDALGISTSTDLLIPISIGSIPFNSENKKIKLTYEQSEFELSKIKNEIHPTAIGDLDENASRPYYPFYNEIN